MTGPEHYREAECLLAQANGQYLDDSSDPAPRKEYASDADWVRAMEESAEAHDLSLRTAALFAQMAAVHATLAAAAAMIAAPFVGEGDTTETWLRVTSSAKAEGGLR